MTPTKRQEVPSKTEVNNALDGVAVTTQAKTLAESTMYLKLRFGRLGNSKKVSTSQMESVFGSETEVETDESKEKEKEFIRASRKLLNSPELIAIRDFDAETKRYVEMMAHPFDTGIRLISDKAVPKMCAYLERRAADRETLVDVFMEAYPSLCEKASERKLYNPNDYLPADAARREFVFTWNWLNFGTPDKLRAINREVYSQEVGKIQGQVQQAAQEIKEDMRLGLLMLVENLKDKLTVGDDGKKKVLSSAAVKNVQEFLDLFEFRDVTSDVELKKVVEQVRSVLGGVDRDALAASVVVRDRVKDEFAQIAVTLDGMVSTRGRKFRKELEE
ncbi:MAG: hypothetical protein ACRDQZ_11795 [Mycobacteriales bacterium]